MELLIQNNHGKIHSFHFSSSRLHYVHNQGLYHKEFLNQISLKIYTFSWDKLEVKRKRNISKFRQIHKRNILFEVTNSQNTKLESILLQNYGYLYSAYQS